MDPPATLKAGDADAKALAHARAVMEALPCPTYTPHTHSSGAPSKLKVPVLLQLSDAGRGNVSG